MTSKPLASRALALAATLFTASGCASATDIFALRCDVAVTEVAPQPAIVGESVTITGQPFTSVYDSAVYIGAERAEVIDVERADCLNCDTCRAQQGCTECSDCDACDTICSTECVETVTFDVPDLEAGEHALQLFNAHGQSPVLPFSVESTGYEGDSSDTADTGDSGTTGVGPGPLSP